MQANVGEMRNAVASAENLSLRLTSLQMEARLMAPMLQSGLP
jgi:hypothetical protein